MGKNQWQGPKESLYDLPPIGGDDYDDDDDHDCDDDTRDDLTMPDVDDVLDLSDNSWENDS